MKSEVLTDVVERWGVFELVLSGPSAGNPFLEVELTAQFTQGDHSVAVSGFYDGDGRYCVRFMPEWVGEWRYRTQSSAPELSGITGAFTCTDAAQGNHGPVRVADAYHFAYADGTAYHPVGTTCYVWNLQGDALEEETLETLKHAPFNKIRFCVFPKRYRFNNNEPPNYPFPGEIKGVQKARHGLTPPTEPPPDYWDFSRFNPLYFQHLEQRVADLQRLGIEADLILFHPYDFGAWGFDRMPVEVNQRYLRYMVARLAAYRNLWWSFANEYELFFERSVAEWDGYFKLVQAADPYNHLRSIHNIRKIYDASKPWVTHVSVQDGDLSQMTRWQRLYDKPVVVDECGYEGNIDQFWGDLTPQEMVARFWLGFADGGYVGHGETYWNPEEVLWWSKGGKLHGQSAARIAFLREIIEGVPGAGLVPISPIRFASLGSIEELFPLMECPDPAGAIIGEGARNVNAGGHSGMDYFLFYYGIHQPLFRNFNLPEGSFDIDVIDTWNMTITRCASKASGSIQVDLPVQPYLAIRIARSV
jgi:hypothetical protein